MDQAQRLHTVIERIRQHAELEPIAVDPQLSDARAMLNFLRVQCNNWRSERLTKIGALRFTVSMPRWDVLNLVMYPDPAFDAPIFIAALVVGKKKVFAYLSAIAPFDEPDYVARWIEPLVAAKNAYPSFESSSDEPPDWLGEYHNDAKVLGSYSTDRLADLHACMLDYVGIYLQALGAAQRVEDAARRASVEAFQAEFRLHIRTRKRAQAMTSRFLGKDRTHKIFYEVAT